MLWVEVQYVNRLAAHIKNFKQKSSYLWNCSCPLCGDISKGRQKARGYFYRMKTHLSYKCHHCGASMSLGTFLKDQHPNLYKQFVMERYRESTSSHLPHSDIAPILAEVAKLDEETLLVDAKLSRLTSCTELKPAHPVVKYLERRQIPRDKWELIYYTTKIKDYVNSILPGKFKTLETDHPRLVFPYFNEHGKVFAISARAFKNEEPKYYTIKFDDDADRIYGLDRVVYSRRVYALEGQIDSLFLPNAIAVSGSSYDGPTLQALKTNLTIVPDNEPRSKEICHILSDTIKLGYSVCLWPHTITEKDINEMVLAGRTVKEILEIIDANTFSGLTAQIKFAEWRMC